MITTKNGNVTIDGNGIDLLTDTAFIVASVTNALKETEIPAELLKVVMVDVCSMAVEAGVEDKPLTNLLDVIDRKTEEMRKKQQVNKDIDDLIDEIFAKMLEPDERG